MAIDYTIPQFQTTQDASVPKGTIQTPTTPSPVYPTPDIGSIYDQTVPPESQLSKERTAGLNFYKQLLGEQAQSQQEQAQQFQNLGGAEAQTRLADLTAQYNVADLQNQAQQQAYLGQTRAIGGYTQTAQNLGMEDINRANAVKKLGLASDIAINQGRVDTAKSLAEQAIKAKYGDVQAKIDQTKAFLDVNKDLLSREDAKNLQRQQFILQNKQKEIDAKVKDQTDISNMIIDATPNAPASIVANAKKIAEQGGSKLAVAQALGEYAGDYWGTKLKIAQYNKLVSETAKIDKQTSGLKLQPTGLVTTPNGDSVSLPNRTLNAIGQLKLNEGQSNAVAFVSRMIQADAAIKKQLGTISPTGGFYETSGYDPTSVGSGFGRAVGSDNSRIYNTNSQDFIRAKLRKESGATISPEEFSADASIYTPSGMGLDQKDLLLAETKREEAIKSMIAQAGPAAPYLQQYYEQVKANNGVPYDPYLDGQAIPSVSKNSGTAMSSDAYGNSLINTTTP